MAKQNSPTKIIYLMTSNPDKVAEYQELFHMRGAPVIVQSADVILREFYHAQEISKSVEGNVSEKRNVLADVVSVLQKHYPDKKKKKELLRHIYNNVQQLNQQYGGFLTNAVNNPSQFPQSDFLKNNIYFAVEDSSIGAAPIIWQYFDKTNIPQDIIERIDASVKNAKPKDITTLNEPQYGVPGVELAPVNAAIGTKEVVRRLHEAAETAGLKPEVAGYSMLEMVNLAQLEQKGFHGRGPKKDFTQYQVYEGKSEPYLLAEQPFIPTAHPGGINSYFIPKDNRVGDVSDNAAAVATYRELFLRGARKGVVDGIMQDLGIPESTQALKFAVSAKGSHASRLREGMLDTDQVVSRLRQHAEEEPVKKPPNISDIFTRSLNYVEQHLHDVDITVLPPMLTRKIGEDADLKRFVDYFTLNSLVTAKMLIGRDKPKPVIVQNVTDDYAPEGCWQQPVDMHHHLVGNQMCRDANLDPSPLLKEGLTHAGVSLPESVNIQHNDYFTTITGNAEDVSEATQKLIEYWKPRLIKVDMPGQADEQVRVDTRAAKEEDGNRFKVGIFLSASSENDTLLESTREFCKSLVEKNIGIVYGGGDQHLMGAIYEGVKKYADQYPNSLPEERPLLKAYSTHEILKTESKHGDFPKGKERKNIQFYGKLCRDIYHRMGDMLADSDLLVFRPGGAGTMQELTAALMIRKLHPELAEEKPIIICDSKLHAHDEQHFFKTIIDQLFPSENSAYNRSDETINVGNKISRYEKISNGTSEAPVFITHDDATAQAIIDRYHIAHNPEQRWQSSTNKRAGIESLIHM